MVLILYNKKNLQETNKKGENYYIVANWKQEYSNLNQGNNYLGVFSTTYRNIPIKAFVFASCSMNEFENKRIVFANLFFEANKKEITDGIFHDVNEECFDLVKPNIPNNNLFQTAFINYYLTEELPVNIPFGFGDYTLF